VVDERDNELPAGAAGELILRHDEPWVLMSGYLDDPAATAAAWRNGWFHTGDQMTRDREGNFVFVDRQSDVIRRRGENISSFEVEAAITSFPAVVQAAAVGVPAAEGEDDLLAFVVIDAGREPPPARELLEYLIGRLPHFMVPRYIEFVGELPRTPTDKVRKAELRRRGIGPGTWDREAAGIVVRAPRF
jgi:crotonobetaine/carnitine-CoA ligase